MTLLMTIMLVVNPTLQQQVTTEYASATAIRETPHLENKELSLDWTIPDWARCAEHWSAARQAGWTEDQMSTLDYIMFRESRCNAGALNRYGCKGLLQLCNWSCDGSCREALPNLKKGHDLFLQSGWHPWCLRGDPVTGNC